jgi:uncharacterized protein (TIGR02466 family)
MKDKLLALFPEPVFISDINRNISKTELNYLNKIKKSLIKNQGNYTSESKYILNCEELKNIKNDLHACIKKYFEEIIQTRNLITLYITQSWLNITKHKEYHHMHYHPNSYLSGVLYIDANEKCDSIIFHKGRYEEINLVPKNYNIFNSITWEVPVKTGMIILFPSHLRHSVGTKLGKNLRTSLAFNVFLKGKIGSEIESNELFL